MPREYSSGACHSPLRDSEMMIKVMYTYKVWYLPKLISSHRDHHTTYGICRFSLVEENRAIVTAQLGGVSHKIHIFTLCPTQRSHFKKLGVAYCVTFEPLQISGSGLLCNL